MATKEFKGLEPVGDTGDAAKSLDADFPNGTMMRLTVKKYLWAVTGAIGIDVPIATWEDVYDLVEDWVEYQGSLVEEYEDELAEVYSNSPRSRGRGRGTSSGGGNRDVLSTVRGKMFSLATKKGVHVTAKYPDYKDWDVKEVEAFMEELDEMPDKGDDAGKSATSRVRRARSSRR